MSAGATLFTQVRWVCFDVGETLIDETRDWAAWADGLGVTHLTFFAALGAVIAARRDHREAFQLLQPGFDLAAARAARAAAGQPEQFGVDDLYPDVRPLLTQLRAAGLRIAIAGNQPLWAEAALDAIRLPADLVAASERWGVHKPSPDYFARLVAETGAAPEEIAYVGDRLDNDVLPARAAGLWTIFLRSGPWEYIHATWPERERAHAHIDSLDELAGLLGLGSASPPSVVRGRDSSG